MTSSRLRVLLAALALLVVLRIAVPPASNEHALVEAVVHGAPAITAASPSTEPVAVDEPSMDMPADVPGNAFPVRTVSMPAPASPPIVATPLPVRIAAPPQPPAQAPVIEPVPPLQVIGTYDDGRTAAVFIATPLGIRIARPGTLLMSEYQVAGIAPGHVTFTQVSSQRSFDLPLPASRP